MEPIDLGVCAPPPPALNDFNSRELSESDLKCGRTEDEKVAHSQHLPSRKHDDRILAARVDDDDDEKKTETGLPRSSPTKTGLPDSSILSHDSPITYLYLTFDTVLPTPHVPSGTAVSTTASAPVQLDLSRYVNPLRWPKARKNMMVALSCIATCLTAYTAGAYSPPIDLIAAELNTTHEVALLGVTTFCLGFAIAPMILAPFSEINGRYPVFAVAGVFFTVFQAVCGVVTTVTGMLFARFFKGVGGSVFSTMVGGVISDLYDKEGRNTPMALFSGSVLVGTGLGPLISSLIVEAWGSEGQKWKWVFWHQVIADFVLMIAVITLFKESRGSVILSRKAKALNKWYEDSENNGVFGVWIRESLFPALQSTQSPVQGPENYNKKPYGLVGVPSGNKGLKLRRIRWLVKEDEQRGSIITMISTSFIRPFHFLFTEPIVFFFSLWVSFAWAVLYLTFGSVPLVFRRQYNFNIEQSGFVFAAMIIGSILATVIGIFQEDLLKHPRWQDISIDPSSGSGRDVEYQSHSLWAFIRRKFPVDLPESRLYFTCFTAVLLPAGLYLFGFAAQPSIHWIVPTIAIGFATMGIYYIYLATFNYLADIYQAYASSALAAQSFCRNILGGVFPLVTALLFTNLGEDAAGGVLGAIATVLTVVPWVLVLFGEKIRRRSKFAIALEKPKSLHSLG
ncbi:major facilitator superfamily domain-containing protein [Xylariaceae sp. FL1651]|nr:major facilitator superfamily domain-containing protein [Xylariaceae sp. FL1651]